jgi:dolichol-phosphate mannosyltransferase
MNSLLSISPASARLAPAASKSTVTVVVPTYQEVENIPHLVERLRKVREEAAIDLQLLIMDDDSGDGTDRVVDALALHWVTLVTRKSKRGLSDAVLDGLRRATGEVVVVMDADLSHPPEKIPKMLDELANGAEVVVGSRFAEGGSTADDWGFFRWLNSRVATLMALPLTRLSDPMSGFFAMRRETFAAGRDFNPIGYKILLEILIKCRCRQVLDIPIHFDNRRYGESKLSFREQLKYIQHLRRLYIFKYGTWSHLAQFLVVGFSGLLVNLAAITLLLHLPISKKNDVAIAIVLSIIWNFALNRRFSFSYARHQSIVRQFVGFVAACSLGAVVNYVTTVALWDAVRYRQMAVCVGVVAGALFNFVASRFLIFRIKHVKP